MSAFKDLEDTLNNGVTPSYILVSKAFYECQNLLCQYRSDLRYPPSLIARINRYKEIKDIIGT